MKPAAAREPTAYGELQPASVYGSPYWLIDPLRRTACRSPREWLQLSFPSWAKSLYTSPGFA
jgi:hypothetical protein